jgi:HD-GYP domain-containing protein (c-di-GMP phosphodiesterase class II)
MVRNHHEFVDGTGYPDRLKGEEIPLGARIIAVADCFDTMTSERAYKPGRTIDQALEELRRCSGTQFDANIVENLARSLEPNDDLVPHGSVKKPQVNSLEDRTIS